jgi:hypothetical protein
MFSSATFSKIARLAGTSVALGTIAAVMLLGGPADAAILIRMGRGL